MKLFREPLKSVLFILYQFPPSNDVGAQRPMRFIRHLGRWGWHSVVLAPANGVYHSYDTQSASAVADCCTVVRAPMFFPAPRTGGPERPAAGAMSRWLWRAWNRAALPDGAAAWLPGAVGFGVEIVRRCNASLLLASGQPFSTFLIARAIKRRTGKKLVLDYRDPWTLNPFYKGSNLRRHLERRIERAVLRSADAAVFTTDEARLNQMAHFRRPRRHFESVTITNSFEPDDSIRRERIPTDDFVVIHAGNLYGSRNPKVLFAGVAAAAAQDHQFARLARFKFFGVFDADRYRRLSAALGIEKLVEFAPRIPRSELELHYRRASVLLLINSYGKGHHVFIPSKFFDYLKTGLPIFCLADDGALKSAVRNTDSGVVVDPRDPQQTARELLRLFERVQSKKTPPGGNVRSADVYEAAHTTRQLADLFDRLMGRR
jgi:glycosyltransferase involved in cell wall biosynthesis